MVTSKGFVKSIIENEPKPCVGKYIIYEMVHIETNQVFYVGRTSLPLYKRIQTHFCDMSECKELSRFIQANRDRIRVRVIQITSSRKREKYWVKRRAIEYKLFNSVYLISQVGRRKQTN